MVSDDDERRVAAAMTKDVVATLGAGYALHIEETAAHHRQFTDDFTELVRRVVDDVQQWLHDMCIDTAWPACPVHQRHPMWFRDGAWCLDDVPAAKLGELALVMKPVVFSYGTLQNAEVQLATFGRVLEGRADALPGFALGRVPITDSTVIAETGLTHYANVVRSDEASSHVSGVALELTAAELLAADRYEADAAYVRRAVTLASGREAWVYAHGGPEGAT
jgi:hypothetical protein